MSCIANILPVKESIGRRDAAGQQKLAVYQFKQAFSYGCG